MHSHQLALVMSKEHLMTYKSAQIIPRFTTILFQLKWFSAPQFVQVMWVLMDTYGAIDDNPWLLLAKHGCSWP